MTRPKLIKQKEKKICSPKNHIITTLYLAQRDKVEANNAKIIDNKY